MQFRADSIDVKARSIEAVLATENPVPVLDWNRGEIVDEILLMSGCRRVEQMQLLHNHRRWDLDDVIGSVRDIVITDKEFTCRFYFTDVSEHLRQFPEDQQALLIERTWLKVKQRHQRESSIGYRVLESIIIPAGETQIVRGKQFTAGKRPLRIATDWLPREGSLTPIAADMAATTRKEEDHMDKLLKYCISIGLRSDATVAEMWTFIEGLTAQEQRAEVNRQIAADKSVTLPEKTRTVLGSWSTATTPPADTRAEPTPGTQAGGTTNGSTQTRTGETEQFLTREEFNRLLDQRIAEQNERTAHVTAMFQEAGIENPALLQRALREGWDRGRTALELQPLILSRASAPVDADAGGLFQGGVHSRMAPSTEAVGLALMARNGAIPIDRNFSDDPFARMYLQRTNPVLLMDVNNENRQRAMEAADRLQRRCRHLMDYCQLGLELSGNRASFVNDDEMIRAAISS